MEKRGNNKRHTLALGSVDEVEKLQTSSPQSSNNSPAASSRTRRTGLLTVMERPPGEFKSFFFLSLSLFLIKTLDN